MALLDEKRDRRQMISRVLVLALAVNLVSPSCLAMLQAKETRAIDDASAIAANAKIEQTADVKNATVGGPHDIVNRFLDGIREGKKTINGISGSWQHVWELTTRESGAGLGLELIGMCRDSAFRASVAVGNKSRALVLTTAIRYNSRPGKYIGIIDVVHREGRWLVRRCEVSTVKVAWATVRGFARDPSVRFLVQPGNVVGTYMTLSCGSGVYEFLPDGQYRHVLFTNARKETLAEGTWHLDGAALVRITDQGESRQEISQIRPDGFSVRLDEKLDQAAIESGFQEFHFWRVTLPEGRLNRLNEPIKRDEPGAVSGRSK